MATSIGQYTPVLLPGEPSSVTEKPGRPQSTGLQSQTLPKRPCTCRCKTFFCLWQLCPSENWAWRWCSCLACGDPGSAKCAGTQTASTAGIMTLQFSQFSHSVMSDSLQPHELQHARPPCLSPTPGVYPNSCPLSQWYHPAISSSDAPFFSCLQSFPASGSFPMSQLFSSGGQSIGVSASTSVLPRNIQDWPPLGWTGWIFLQSKGLSKVFSNTTVQKHQFFGTQLSL